MSTDTQQQKRFKILVIGDACLDVYYFGTCDRISPEAPVPVFKKSRISSQNGMCLNVASNLSAFGHDVKVDKNSETIRKIRIIDSKTGSQVLRIDEEPDIKNVDVRKYTSSEMRDFDAMVISDYNKGFITPGDILDVIEPARLVGIPIFVDSKKKDLSHFEGCILKINEKEKDEVDKFPSRYELLTTLGSRGCEWRGTVYPTKKVDVHDVCGAGDVFLASLVHTYLTTGGNMIESIRFANHCSSISVKHFGTWVIDLDEIL